MGDSLQKNWGREEEGGAGCFPRTEVLGWWQHLKAWVVNVRPFWVISSPVLVGFLVVSHWEPKAGTARRPCGCHLL